MFVRSAGRRSSPASAALPLSTGTDSPVKDASWMRRLTAERIRTSAGTMLPASRRTMSPRTSSRAGMSRTQPSRRTLASGAASFVSAANAFSARCSWRNPRRTLRTTMARMAAASSRFPNAADTPAAPRSSTTSVWNNWALRISGVPRPAGPESSFGLPSSSRRAASASVNPRAGSQPSARVTASGSSVCQEDTFLLRSAGCLRPCPGKPRSAGADPPDAGAPGGAGRGCPAPFPGALRGGGSRLVRSGFVEADAVLRLLLQGFVELDLVHSLRVVSECREDLLLRLVVDLESAVHPHRPARELFLHHGVSSFSMATLRLFFLASSVLGIRISRDTVLKACPGLVGLHGSGQRKDPAPPPGPRAFVYSIQNFPWARHPPFPLDVRRARGVRVAPHPIARIRMAKGCRMRRCAGERGQGCREDRSAPETQRPTGGKFPPG